LKIKEGISHHIRVREALQQQKGDGEALILILYMKNYLRAINDRGNV
jgi:hypothetical protein